MNLKAVIGILLSGFFLSSCSKEPESAFGVWANNHSELVITRHSVLYYSFAENTYSSTCICRDNASKKLFFAQITFNDSILNKSIRPLDEDSLRVFRKLRQSGTDTYLWDFQGKTQELSFIEKIEVVDPYEMLYATDTNAGSCLQQWMLGNRTVIDPSRKLFFCQTGTNQHSYMFDLSTNYTYCRAARIRSNNSGTLFAQNFRIWVKGNEQMAFMAAENVKVSASSLVINDSLFNSNVCYYDKTGIYWSIDSLSSNKIVLNGCGQHYPFERPDIHQNLLTEWFRFSKY